MPPPTELSIIVPLLNERERILLLLRMLARQEGISFEVILSDGGSTDDTLELAGTIEESLPYALTIVSGPRGRGGQLNRGVSAAGGEWLLFLHADSVFPDPAAITKGITAVREASRAKSDGRLAGRFTLRFDRGETPSSFGYSFCEGQARLHRDGCILGDQGFLLSRKLLETIGPFDEALPLGEDLEMARRICRNEKFLLLPAEILTSPRRFQREGYRSRQTLNALLMGLLISGHSTFLTSLAGSYEHHAAGRPLELEPFFRHIATLVATLPGRERLIFWYRIGDYVRSNIWQLAFALDLHRSRQQGNGGGEGRFLQWYDRYLEPMSNHPPGVLLTGGVVLVWFYAAKKWRWLREGVRSNEKRAG